MVAASVSHSASCLAAAVWYSVLTFAARVSIAVPSSYGSLSRVRVRVRVMVWG